MYVKRTASTFKIPVTITPAKGFAEKTAASKIMGYTSHANNHERAVCPMPDLEDDADLFTFGRLALSIVSRISIITIYLKSQNLRMILPYHLSLPFAYLPITSKLQGPFHRIQRWLDGLLAHRLRNPRRAIFEQVAGQHSHNPLIAPNDAARDELLYTCQSGCRGRFTAKTGTIDHGLGRQDLLVGHLFDQAIALLDYPARTRVAHRIANFNR